MELEKDQTKSQVSRRKEIIKNRAEINKTETRKIGKLNKTKSWYYCLYRKSQTIYKNTTEQINKWSKAAG